ncbi:Putative membrane protein [Pseudomonas chlororaphis]|uniref:hypothetical protein n=1 Tax=Pseudomonas chlororaphis TaxID=587753 RepID=UPI000F578294|nr:hypothetical protein [Pseudomonas chlororaphis]AZD06418.1 Putative membrane protein [Pseudomonas chlororaphis]
MYESKNQPLLSRLLFLRRLFLHVPGTLGLLGISLLLGIARHLYFEPGVSQCRDGSRRHRFHCEPDEPQG